MVVLVSYTNEEDTIKTKTLYGHKVLCRGIRRSLVDNSVVSCGILPVFQLMQAFNYVLVTWKNEEVLIKM